MSASFSGFLFPTFPAAKILVGLSVTMVFSTMVFHEPQAGQRPIHFGYSFPQFVQKNTVFSFPVTAI